MSSILLKSLIGVGATAVASVGGYFWLSKPSPKTIRERLGDKTPLKLYSADLDIALKEPWTRKMNAYKPHADESILSTDKLDEEKFSNKCKEILDIKWDNETTELKKKEDWAKKWCFVSE